MKNDLGFLYELNTKNGECIITQSISGRIGLMLEHIAKVFDEQERIHGKRNVVIKMLKARVNENTTMVDPKQMESLATLVTMTTEHYNQKAGKLIIENVHKSKLKEDLKKIFSNPKKTKKLIEIVQNEETLELPSLETGDLLLVGKFKNRKAEIKGFDKDDNNQPVAKTNKGDQKIFKPRVAKLMPGAEKKSEDEKPIEEENALTRGRVWCTRCGGTQKVNPVASLRSGWPKCCGQTMTIDSPEERRKLSIKSVKENIHRPSSAESKERTGLPPFLAKRTKLSKKANNKFQDPEHEKHPHHQHLINTGHKYSHSFVHYNRPNNIGHLYTHSDPKKNGVVLGTKKNSYYTKNENGDFIPTHSHYWSHGTGNNSAGYKLEDLKKKLDESFEPIKESQEKIGHGLSKNFGGEYYYQIKNSWNKKYYSFDSGDSWFPTKEAAFKKAQQEKKLHPKGKFKAITHSGEHKIFDKSEVPLGSTGLGKMEDAFAQKHNIRHMIYPRD